LYPPKIFRLYIDLGDLDEELLMNPVTLVINKYVGQMIYEHFY